MSIFDAIETLLGLGDGLDKVGKAALKVNPRAIRNNCPKGYEERRIVVAQGLQFRNKDIDKEDKIPDALVAEGLKIITLGKNEYSYTSDVQKICFNLKIIVSRQHFKKALETPDIHLIYDGHARYGRGPCFGNYDFTNYRSNGGDLPKGEQWENGKGPSDDFGIFRMAYPFIATPADEPIEHGYTANLVPGSKIKDIKKEDCDPDLIRYMTSLKEYKSTDLHPNLHSHTVGKDPKAKWVGYKNKSGVPHVVHYAGWQSTVSKPMDLGATTPKCHVFCHFGCDTYDHNRAILRTKKPWPKNGDYQLAYFTSDYSYGWTTWMWLYYLFTYPKYNAFLPWEPSLKDYVIPKTNARIGSRVVEENVRVKNYNKNLKQGQKHWTAINTYKII